MSLNLHIALWNANGISNHTREIELFLKTNYIDVLLISETHFTSRSYFKIHGYDLIHTNHPDNRAHAGSAILIKSNIKYTILNDVQQPMLQATNIKIGSNIGDIVISAIYFPPRHTIKCQDYENFFNTLGGKFLVGGDFNAKHPWWGSRLINPKGRELYKCLIRKNYSTLSAGSPTYWPSDPRKIPDLLDFIVYKGISNDRLTIANSNDLSSDHTPVLVNLNINHTLNPEKYQILKRNSNISLFQQYLENNVNLNIRLKTEAELDDAVEKFTNLIHTAGSISTPSEINSPPQRTYNFLSFK